MRHRRDDVNIRLRNSRVNPLRVIDRLPTIAYLLKTCRAEALSMPAGPADGRVEAEAESIDDAEHGASIKNAMGDVWVWVCNRDVSAADTLDAPEEVSVQLASRILPANVAPKTCTRTARSSCTFTARKRRRATGPTMA